MFETPPTFHNPGHSQGLPTPEIARAAWDAWSSRPNAGPVGVLMLRPPGPDMPPLPPTPGCGVWLATLVPERGVFAPPGSPVALVLFNYEHRARPAAGDLRAWALPPGATNFSQRLTLANGPGTCLYAHRLAVAQLGAAKLLPIPTA